MVGPNYAEIFNLRLESVESSVKHLREQEMASVIEAQKNMRELLERMNENVTFWTQECLPNAKSVAKLEAKVSFLEKIAWVALSTAATAIASVIVSWIQKNVM
ncbi:hypothetical protein [Dehalococcoides mccartyi]|uniref:hypothetical protein n=1 Tax=Dehalococcoides mccartyi TaxID=61435 RepID=UPI000805A7C5|nr:hypothetical protein [Dehalococcoides mccartyi]OBW61992.1 MAG: hypothetical protein A9181_03215 [Dehalococcoides mccartyi]BEL00770.1 hypothetical protein DMOBY_06230 [Dehalococcoides mccartyi]